MEQRKTISQKKGIQLSQAFGAVLTLVLVAVLVVIAIVIFVSLTTSFVGTSTVSLIPNETLTSLTESPGVTLNAALTNCSFSSPSIVTLANASEAIGLTNVTLSSTGVATFSGATTDASGINNTDLFITYSWQWGSDACEASETMIDELGNYTSLIGLVGTIIFLALVIGVLVASFAFGGRKDGA